MTIEITSRKNSINFRKHAEEAYVPVSWFSNLLFDYTLALPKRVEHQNNQIQKGSPLIENSG